MKQQQYRRGEVENDEYAAPEEEEEEECRIRVRPGVRGAARKVSIGVDATPAARTDSVLEQIPIEVARSGEYLNSFEDAATTLGPSEYCEPTELNDDAAAAVSANDVTTAPTSPSDLRSSLETLQTRGFLGLILFSRCTS